MSRKSIGGRNHGHGGRYQTVHAIESGLGYSQGASANALQGRVVHAVGLNVVLGQILKCQHDVIRLNPAEDQIGRREDGVGAQTPTGILVREGGHDQRTQTGSCSSTDRMNNLEPIQAVTFCVIKRIRY